MLHIFYINRIKFSARKPTTTVNLGQRGIKLSARKPTTTVKWGQREYIISIICTSRKFWVLSTTVWLDEILHRLCGGYASLICKQKSHFTGTFQYSSFNFFFCKEIFKDKPCTTLGKQTVLSSRHGLVSWFRLFAFFKRKLKKKEKGSLNGCIDGMWKDVQEFPSLRLRLLSLSINVNLIGHLIKTVIWYSRLSTLLKRLHLTTLKPSSSLEWKRMYVFLFERGCMFASTNVF